jgi:dTDP-glucose pyrophosphorylase
MTRSIDSCRVTLGQNLRDAMWALDRGNVQIALVVDDQERLVGTLTDGDIRRALLRGAQLDSPLAPFVQRRYAAVGPDVGRAQVLELMQARLINQVPIVDTEGRLIGLHLLQEMLGASERPNWAVIMAGGKGLRLRPITEYVPKPMLAVAGRPILERLVLHLVGFGIRRIYLAVNYRAELIEAHFGDGARFGCHVEYLREEVPLGTGGALSLLPERPTAPLLAMNGDLVTQFDVGGLLSFHEQGGYAATLALHQYSHTIPYGQVELQDDRVRAIHEKPTVSWPVNAGIYVLQPGLIDRIPKGREFPLPTLLEESLRKDEAVGAFLLREDWIDIGRTDELRRARGEVQRP